MTIDLGHSENGTRISRTVSEIFDRKHIALNAIFLQSSSLLLLFFLLLLLFFPTCSLATYLLLQEWSHPENFDIISKLGIGRREFLILAGKFQLVDSQWGKQFPHYKHRRRRINSFPSISISVCLNAFAQFSRYRVETSQVRQRLSGRGREGVDDSTVPRGAQK